jgi:hypothetical protein
MKSHKKKSILPIGVESSMQKIGSTINNFVGSKLASIGHASIRKQVAGSGHK